jgi:hypothetical protein
MNLSTIFLAGCLGVFLLASGFLAAVAVLYHYFGVLGAAVPFALLVLAAWGFKLLLHRLFLLPFILKGNALKGARIEVHACEPIGMEDGSFMYRVNFTIHPRRMQRFYDPGELLLVAVDQRMSYSEDPTGDTVGTIQDLQLLHEGEYIKDFDKVCGAQRFQATVAMQQPQDAKFRYYFNFLGILKLTVPA